MTLDYTIVPFFALMSLLILIIYVIIWRFFRICVWCFSGQDAEDSSSLWDRLRLGEDVIIVDVVTGRFDDESHEGSGAAGETIIRYKTEDSSAESSSKPSKPGDSSLFG